MLSIDPDATRVVLIGASEFPRDPDHLPELPAVKANIWDLARLLHDPGIVGIPAGNIVTILNEEKASDVQEKLAKVAKEATDTLVVYYSGHGLVGRTSSEL